MSSRWVQALWLTLHAGCLACADADITKFSRVESGGLPATPGAMGSIAENPAPRSDLPDPSKGLEVPSAPPSTNNADASGEEPLPPRSDVPDANTPHEPACEKGELTCRGSLIAQCNASRSDFELVRDCRTAEQCEDAVARCAFGGCSERELGCSLAELADGSAGVHSIGLGRALTCAVVTARNVRCWGWNRNGQLGYGHTRNIGDETLPAAAGDVDLGGPVAQVVAGVSHACALFTNGEVGCWGRATSGRLGYGNEAQRRYFEELGGRSPDVGDDETPASVGRLQLGGSAIQLAAGDDFTCALLLGGEVRCWGNGNQGALGYGSTTNVGDDETPARVAPVQLGGPAAFIAAGASHSCAILASGEVRCWGRAAYGVLGYGNTEDIGDDETPASAGSVRLHETATALSASATHTCALLRSGALQCWGDGRRRALGYDDPEIIGDDEWPTSRPAVEAGGRATQVATGDDYTCALLEGGRVRCWGASHAGRLGDPAGTARPLSSARDRVELGGDALQIDAYDSHACAVLSTRELVCWGEGADGRLGYGNAEPVGDDETPASLGQVPVLRVPDDPDPPVGPPPPPEPLPDAGAVSPDLDPPPRHDALDAGLVSLDADAAGPDAAASPPPGSGIHSLALGSEHTCVLTLDGAVRCWGDNAKGQLGYGHEATIGFDNTAAAAGEVVLGGRARQVVAGQRHTCALLENGDVRCWGEGNNGQLGLGMGEDDVGDDELPIAVPPLQLGGPVRQLATGGGGFTCALLENGDVRCWGSGRRGQLGVAHFISETNDNVGDDEVPSSVPPVEIGPPVVAIAAGQNHGCALTSLGGVRCWGRGDGGRLGYGNKLDIGDDETPASAGDVALGGVAIELALGTQHSCALLSGGVVRCWGSQADRALGHPDPPVFTTSVGDDETPDAAPVIDLGQPALHIVAGARHTCALLEDGAVRCWGYNLRGQLGNGVRATSVPLGASVPRLSLGGLAVAVAAGELHTCAVLDTGELMCWGDVRNGKLGYGQSVIDPALADNDVGDDETPESVGAVPLF